MSEPGSAARPRSDTFEYAGATVELVDAATILAAARVNPVDLMRRAAFPPPVQRAWRRGLGTCFRPNSKKARRCRRCRGLRLRSGG